MEVVITSKSKASKHLWSNSRRPRYLISINDPVARKPSGHRHVTMMNSLFLNFIDVEHFDDPEIYPFPSEEDIQSIIDFAQRIKDEEGKLLIHCYAGQCRSTAAGFIVYSVWLGDGKEEEALRLAAEASTEAPFCPNEVMVEIADKLLDRGGKLENTLEMFQAGSKGMYE